MTNTQTAISALATVMCIGMIVLGLDACDDRTQAFKRACVSNGGTLLSSGGGTNCIARGVTTGQQ